MKNFLLLMGLIIVFSGAGCAAKEKVICPTVEEEEISVCRAKQKCLNLNTSTGVGVGFGFGLGPNTGTAVGIDVNRNQIDDTYPNCIDRDLDAQKAAAHNNLKKIDEKKTNK